MNTKAMRWVIYLGMAIALVNMLGGCDDSAVQRPAKSTVEQPAPRPATPAERDAAAQRRDELYRDWPQPKLRSMEGTDGRS